MQLYAWDDIDIENLLSRNRYIQPFLGRPLSQENPMEVSQKKAESIFHVESGLQKKAATICFYWEI